MCDSCAWETAVETADEILEMVDEIPEAGEEFATGIEERVRSIRAWITEHSHTTDKQIDALDNMHAGAEKWLQR